MAKLPMTYILGQVCDPINNRLGLTRNSKEKARPLTIFMADWQGSTLPATSYPKAFHGVIELVYKPASPVYEWKFRSQLSLNDSIQFACYVHILVWQIGTASLAWTRGIFIKKRNMLLDRN